MPRTIHDVNDVVLLVSTVYACEDGHRLLAHDARVLKMITSPSLVLFVLLHQTGFTKEFVTPHAQRERGKVIDRGVHIYMFVVEKKIESYFRDRLTFSNVDCRTSRRIYRLVECRTGKK